MKTLQEQIEKVLSEIPYDKIREEAFVALNKDGILKGVGEDTSYMVMEQVDLFKLGRMKRVRNQVWEIVFRQIRKTLSHGIKEFTEKRYFEESMKNDLSNIDIGEAATA